MKSGIYVWKLDGIPKYVGQGLDIKKRMFLKHSECKILNRAIKKYGYDSFEKEIICYCESEELSNLETYYIKELHTHISEGGYNVSWGGNTPMKGLKHSEKTKKRFSELSSGKNNPLYGVRRFGKENPFFGKSHSEESLNKNRMFHLGKKKENTSSKYFGVSRQIHCRTKKIYWRPSIRLFGKSIYLGNYKEEISAAIAYDIFIIYKGLSIPINFPNSRQCYIDYLSKFEIKDIKELRRVIKLYITEQGGQ